MTAEQKTPGQIAYEAESDYFAAKLLFDGTPWDVLEEDERQAYEAAAEAVRAPLLARIAKLEARLEIDRVFRCDPDNTHKFIRVEIPPEERDNQIDGIDARDCTIKLQDARIDKLIKRIAELQARLDYPNYEPRGTRQAS
jgi:hypothetical protein